MRKEIEIFDYANEILKGIQKGALLTTKADDFVNTMAISWGTLGIEWNKPIFIAYVRENRFTKQMLTKNPEFTINIPIGEYDKNIITVCGTKSGDSHDKIQELNLTLVEGHKISVPGIKELALTLECKVIYKQAQDETAISQEDKNRFYPQDVDSSFSGANQDYHTAYYAQIVSAYIID